MTDSETKIAVLVPSSFVDALDKAAKRDLQSRSSYIRAVLIEALRARGIIKIGGQNG
jgi:metal-responsive CopG/Arc/MetJ family transcriptional regulator